MQINKTTAKRGGQSLMETVVVDYMQAALNQ